MAHLQQLEEDLWIIDFPFQVGGLQLGTRTTLVRTAEGLWMHSPGPLDAALKAEIAGLGQVVHVVAPNTMHYLFLAEAKRAFPEAITWAGAALRRKVPALPVDKFLESQSEWSDSLCALTLDGIPRLEETVFYHARSRTLIVTDLVFNLRHSGHWFTRWFMKANGAYGRFGPSRIFRRLLTSDAARLGKSLSGILEWDIERVVMGHGEVLSQGGGKALDPAFAWATGR